MVSTRISEPDKYDFDCQTPEEHTGGLRVLVGAEYCGGFLTRTISVQTARNKSEVAVTGLGSPRLGD